MKCECGFEDSNQENFDFHREHCDRRPLAERAARSHYGEKAARERYFPPQPPSTTQRAVDWLAWHRWPLVFLAVLVLLSFIAVAIDMPSGIVR